MYRIRQLDMAFGLSPKEKTRILELLGIQDNPQLSPTFGGSQKKNPPLIKLVTDPKQLFHKWNYSISIIRFVSLRTPLVNS